MGHLPGCHRRQNEHACVELHGVLPAYRAAPLSARNQASSELLAMLGSRSTSTTNSVASPSQSRGSPYLPFTRKSGDRLVKSSAWASLFRVLHLLQEVAKLSASAGPR